MDLQQMRYFLTVAETGNITKAANLLHMAQPPLSRQIKQIEAELNTQLFDRSGRQMILTEAGTLLVYRVRDILNLTSRSMEEIKSFNNNTGGTLTLGTVSSISHTLLPQIIKAFQVIHPKLKIKLIIEETIKITELLEKGVIEVALVKKPFDTHLFANYFLPEEKLAAVFNKNLFRSFAQNKSLSVNELAAHPLLIHHKYETLITNIFTKYNHTPNYFCQSNDILPLLSWADAGLGIIIIPKTAANILKSNNLSVMDIDDPDMVTTTAIIWLQKHHHSVLANNFINFFIDYFEKQKNADY